MGVGKMIWANVLIEEQQEPYIDDDEIEHNDIKRYIGKVKPEPYINDATCPICDSKVIPKCGSINVWHFAHESLKDCDTFSEGETEWHIDWKNEFFGRAGRKRNMGIRPTVRGVAHVVAERIPRFAARHGARRRGCT